MILPFQSSTLPTTTTNATKERIIMSDTLGGGGGGGQIRRTHLYITSSGKVEKCDSYKRNMRGEMIYTTTAPPHSLDVK